MLSLLAAAVLCAAPPDPPADGLALLRRMHAAYAGRWYRTLTFRQKASYPDGRTETWHEAMALPGRLRIDIEPIGEAKTIIFRRDSVYEFVRDSLAGRRAIVHPLLLLGFDVYHDAPERSAAKLADLGFDLARVREGVWQGRKAWVVGTIDTLALSREFWVDQERLVFVKMVQAAPRDPSLPPSKRNIGEILFNGYRRAGGGWVAEEVAFFNNGERVMMEEYANVQADVPLPDELFDPTRWRRPAWVR